LKTSVPGLVTGTIDLVPGGSRPRRSDSPARPSKNAAGPGRNPPWVTDRAPSRRPSGPIKSFPGRAW